MPDVMVQRIGRSLRRTKGKLRYPCTTLLTLIRITPVGINYNFTQEDASGANAGTNIITGIAVTANNFYLSNTGDGGTFDSGTEQLQKLALNNNDGMIAQLDAVNAITTTAGLRDMDMDSTGKRILFGGNSSHDVYAAEYATAEDVTSTLTSKGSILNPGQMP